VDNAGERILSSGKGIWHRSLYNKLGLFIGFHRYRLGLWRGIYKGGENTALEA